MRTASKGHRGACPGCFPRVFFLPLRYRSDQRGVTPAGCFSKALTGHWRAGGGREKQVLLPLPVCSCITLLVPVIARQGRVVLACTW